MKYIPRDLAPTLADRLKFAMDQLGLNQSQVAKLSKCSQTTIFKILDGQTLESRKTGTIAQALGVSVAWLANGEMPSTVTTIHRYQPNTKSEPHMLLERIEAWDSSTPLENDEVEIPLYKQVELAAGSGRAAVQTESGRVLRFSLATLKACGVDPANAQCATVTGRSQEPLILSGATIGIDRGMTKILPGQLYALEQDGELRVKFLERLDNGGIKLVSYNTAEFPSEVYSFEQYMEHHMQVLGRVFWWSTVRPVNASPLPTLCCDCSIKT